MLTPKKRHDHYLPAGLIGGFGTPSTRPGRSSLRYSTVAVRFHSKPGSAGLLRADAVAKRFGEYWMDNPPAGAAPNVIDSIWDEYEPALPGAIGSFEDGTWTAADWDVIRKHLGGVGVRHPVFHELATKYWADSGLPISTRDEVQVERAITYAKTPSVLAEMRFALVHAPDDQNRLVINDKGFAKVWDCEAEKGGILFPLSGMIGILAVPQVGALPGRECAWLCDEMTLQPAAVAAWNDAAWRMTGTHFIVGHPDDGPRLEAIGMRSPVELPELPYRGCNDAGMCDWAFEASASAELRGTGAP